MMKVAIYSPYLDTLGGGELYIVTIAEYLSKANEVVIFWDDERIKDKLEKRFGLDLNKVKILPNVFSKNLVKKWQVLKKFDLAIYLSDGSIPTPLARKNILNFQTPFNSNGNNFLNQIKLSKYFAVVCISEFTKHYIDRTYNIKSQIVYPPVDVSKFASSKKENIIVSVGRFYQKPHSKKQDVMVKIFKKLIDTKKYLIDNGLKLVLIGGSGDKDYFDKVKRIAKGAPIEILYDINFEKLVSILNKSLIYWHAAGYGENLTEFPEKAEHFGISIVEAMAAGCVPMAFSGGGPKEIIDNGVNGFLWNKENELINKTNLLLSDRNLLNSLSKKAITKSKQFSKERFIEEFGKITDF